VLAQTVLGEVLGTPDGLGRGERLGTTSTSGSTGTGLKKCRPITRSGCVVTDASFMIGMDEVLLVSRQSGETIAPSVRNTVDFSVSSSTTASTTTSRSARSASSVVNDSRASAASRSSSLNFPARTARPRDVASRSRADSAAASSTSRRSTSKPARAATSATPDPMMPPPTTPTFSVMFLLAMADTGRCMLSRVDPGTAPFPLGRKAARRPQARTTMLLGPRPMPRPMPRGRQEEPS
jgi:hypothetical protein